MEMHSFRVELAASFDPAFIGKKVFIAEDEILISIDLEEMLARLGFVVVGSARDIAGSLDCIATALPEVAVLDFRLGRETIEPVADALIAAGIPFVMTSGSGGMAYGGAPLLAKPFAFDELRNCMGQVLHNRSSRGESTVSIVANRQQAGMDTCG